MHAASAMCHLQAPMALLLLTASISGVMATSSVSPYACYVAAGLEFRAPEYVVPCINGDGHSPCCLLGDLCLAGNACFNIVTDTLYQYGCTDESYTDESCPYKCGWDPCTYANSFEKPSVLTDNSEVAMDSTGVLRPRISESDLGVSVS